MTSTYIWLGFTALSFIVIVFSIAGFIYYRFWDKSLLYIPIIAICAAFWFGLLAIGYVGSEYHHYNRRQILQDKYGIEALHPTPHRNDEDIPDYKWNQNGKLCTAYYSEISKDTLVNKKCENKEIEVEIDD